MPPIKWRASDIKKLSTYVRKFNAAITRMEKATPSLIGTGVLPERLSVAELRTTITTRSDYNKQLRKIDRLFAKGAREIITDPLGIKTTKWQQREIQYLNQSINAKKRLLIKKYNIPKNQWQFLGLNPIDIKSEQQRLQNEIAKLTDPEDKLNKQQSWYNFMYQVEREASDSYYESNFYKVRNSYLKAIEEHLTPEDAIELMTLLQSNDIWGTDILWAIDENDILDFEYYYSLDDVREKGRNVIEVWKELIPKLNASKKRMIEHSAYYAKRNC